MVKVENNEESRGQSSEEEELRFSNWSQRSDMESLAVLVVEALCFRRRMSYRETMKFRTIKKWFEHTSSISALTVGEDMVRFSFISDCRRLSASVSGVDRLLLGDKLAPARRRTPTIGNRPLMQARCNGVLPIESSALTSAPWSISALAKHRSHCLHYQLLGDGVLASVESTYRSLHQFLLQLRAMEYDGIYQECKDRRLLEGDRALHHRMVTLGESSNACLPWSYDWALTASKRQFLST